MEIATFDLEQGIIHGNAAIPIGVDEAGRGPLAGPVVAAAAFYRHSNFQIPESLQKDFLLIRDSKKLSAKQREVAKRIVLENFYVGIGHCDHITIDRINILEASFLAMKKAITNLKSEVQKNQLNVDNWLVLVDGNKKIPNFSLEQLVVVGGDRLSKSIAAASIVAKVTRDEIMLTAHEKYPQYGFDKHKGYGTKLHAEALEKYGPCEIHRKSFAPVSNLVKARKR